MDASDISHLCQIKRTVSVDMHPNDYYPMKQFILKNLDQKDVEQFRFEKIREVFDKLFSKPEYKEYTAVFGQNPNYSILTKKSTVWIFLIGPMAFFIYKAKPFDIPRIHAIEYFGNEEEIMKKQKSFFVYFQGR